MRIAEIIKSDCANGVGTRLSVFVSGCTSYCKNCFNEKAWDFNYGKPYDESIDRFILKELSKSYYHGITLLGGEPMHPENQLGVLNLLNNIKVNLPNKDVWIYTGFDFEDLLEGGSIYLTPTTGRILELTDVIVDGRYIDDKKDLSLSFRGSSNQRIIDVKKSLESNSIVLYM